MEKIVICINNIVIKLRFAVIYMKKEQGIYIVASTFSEGELVHNFSKSPIYIYVFFLCSKQFQCVW